MTNGWVDIKNADVILAMGGNPAENHPVGFKWFMEAKKTRGAKLVAVDPRFTRTAAVADFYAPLRPGTDIAFLLGLIRYALNNKRYQEDYVRIHTNGPYLIKPEFSFTDGLFSGWDPATKKYVKDTRDKCFVAKNAKGEIVNRNPGIAMIGGCTDTNEFNYLQWKVITALGVPYRDTQARV